MEAAGNIFYCISQIVGVLPLIWSCCSAIPGTLAAIPGFCGGIFGFCGAMPGCLGCHTAVVNALNHALCNTIGCVDFLYSPFRPFVQKLMPELQALGNK